jgi:hypothetical protein
VLENGAVVFRPETVAESKGALSAALKEHANRDKNQDDEHNGCNDELGRREVVTHEAVVIHCILLCGIGREGKGFMVGVSRSKRKATQSILSCEANERCLELLVLKMKIAGHSQGATESQRTRD